MIVTGKLQDGTFVGAARQPDHEVPVEVHHHHAGAVQLTIFGSALLAAALLGRALRGGGRRPRRPDRRPALGRLLPPGGLCRGRLAHHRGGPARDRFRQQRLPLRAGRRPLLDHHAHLLQADRDVVQPGGLAAALGLGAVAGLERGPLHDAPPPPRDRPLGDGDPGRAWLVLHRADDLQGAALRASRSGACGGRRPDAAAAQSVYGGAPADALLGLRAVVDPVRLLYGCADQPQARRELDPDDAQLRAGRLDLPGDRAAARLSLVI